jgi:chromosome segregation protein
MVEEAAGLARFKKRRERAQTKLERTRQNLLRVGDIEREVKTALRPLRRQVEAAERFAEATEQWALAKARLLIHSLIEVGAACDRAGGESVGSGWRGNRSGVSGGSATAAIAGGEQFDAALKSRETVTAAYHQIRVGAEHMASRTVSLRQRLVRTKESWTGRKGGWILPAPRLLLSNIAGSDHEDRYWG